MTGTSSLRRALALSIAAALATTAAAHGQGSGDYSGLQSSTSEQSSAGSTVHVGAGTAVGVTSGYSGEAAVETDAGEDDGGGPPPLPSAELCEAYENQPAHAACLATVLLGENGGDQ